MMSVINFTKQTFNEGPSVALKSSMACSGMALKKEAIKEYSELALSTSSLLMLLNKAS